MPYSWTRNEVAVSTGIDPGVMDLTSGLGPWCDAIHPCGWSCTRCPDHTGRHAAGDGTHIIAVWL